MKTKRKTLKGMTLMEIIISLAILAVLTLVLVQTSTAINTYIRSAKRVNQTVIEQAPVAEMGFDKDAKKLKEDVSIIVNGNITMKANAYQVGGEPATQIVTVVEKDEYGADVVKNVAVPVNEVGGNLNMQFMKVKNPDLVAASTPSTPSTPETPETPSTP